LRNRPPGSDTVIDHVIKASHARATVRGMTTRTRSLRWLAAAVLFAAPVAISAQEPGAPRAADRDLGAEPPHNMCFGGLEDRKRIVHEDQVRNPFRETTRLGCEVDGGRPAVMPDLPSPTRVRTVLG
jgi:hypothetical protein